MPIESTQHLYNLLRPPSWEEMRPYTNEKFIPAPLTTYSADRLTAIGLVWINSCTYKSTYFKILTLISSLESRLGGLALCPTEDAVRAQAPETWEPSPSVRVRCLVCVLHSLCLGGLGPPLPSWVGDEGHLPSESEC